MAAYNIYLLDYTYKGIGYVPELQMGKKIDLTTEKKSSIKSRLQMNFDIICHGSNYNPAVQWAYPSAIGSNELVCYFLEGLSDSIVGWKKLGNVNSKSDGTTVYTSKLGTLSELYMTRFIDDPVLMADLCLHELLHNKLESKLKNRTDIHAEDKGGFGQTVLEPGKYKLSKYDITQMLKAIPLNQPQILVSKADYMAWVSSPFK